MLVGGVPEVNVHLPAPGLFGPGGGGVGHRDVLDGVAHAQVDRLSRGIGTGGVGQLPGEAERQRCREQRGNMSRSAGQLCVHDRSVLDRCLREGSAVVLMRRRYGRARLKLAVAVWPADTVTVCVDDR